MGYRLLHAHPLEYVFFLCAVVVGFFALLEMREALGDAAFIRARQINGRRKLIAQFFAHNAKVRLLKALIMLIGSVVCLVLPPPYAPGDGMPLDSNPSQSTILLVLWVALGCCLVDLAWHARSARRRLRHEEDTRRPLAPGEVDAGLPGGSRSTDPPAEAPHG